MIIVPSFPEQTVGPLVTPSVITGANGASKFIMVEQVLVFPQLSVTCNATLIGDATKSSQL